MRIMGIDPGTQITGVAVLDTELPEGLFHFDYLQTPASQPIPQRLSRLFEYLESALATWKPHHVCVEKLSLIHI